MTYRVKSRFLIDVIQSTLGVAPDEAQAVRIEPPVLSAKWTKNNHHEADILSVTVGFREAGVDPRQIINARCRFALWDDNLEAFDMDRHTRFVGICKTAERDKDESANTVTMTFHDYTSLFLAMKPFKPEGIPEWTDSLRSAWVKICNFTGWQDPANGQIVSTVKIFTRPDGIVFYPPELQARTLGEMVSTRFHQVNKPTPPSRCDAWAVWRWCCESLGLVTFIDKDQCIVADMNEFYLTADGPRQTKPRVVYGENIKKISQKADTTLNSKGILLKSMNPLEGRMIEAFYPPPGDPRIKTRRSAAGKKSEEGANITANEVSGQYDEYEYNWITEQGALQAKAQSAFEERRRQELKGKFITEDMVMRGPNANDPVDVLDLRSGSAILVTMDPEDLETLRAFGSEEERIVYLMDVGGRDRNTATLLARNAMVDQLQVPIFHVTSLSVDYGETSFSIEVEFHNLIVGDL